MRMFCFVIENEIVYVQIYYSINQVSNNTITYVLIEICKIRGV